METALERLKPEIKEQIESESTLYPYIVDKLKEHLTKKHYIRDIEYGYVIELERYARNANFKFDHLYDLFKDFN